MRRLLIATREGELDALRDGNAAVARPRARKTGFLSLTGKACKTRHYERITNVWLKISWFDVRGWNSNDHFYLTFLSTIKTSTPLSKKLLLNPWSKFIVTSGHYEPHHCHSTANTFKPSFFIHFKVRKIQATTPDQLWVSFRRKLAEMKSSPRGNSFTRKWTFGGPVGRFPATHLLSNGA